MRHFEAILLLGHKLRADGSPSHELTLRIACAATCYHKGCAPLIIPCGGQTPNTSISESDVMRAALLALNVPDSAIHCENQSQITVENLLNARKMLPGKRPHVLIVTSDYHMLRAKLICRISAGMRASGCKARIPRQETRAARLAEPLHLIDYMLGYQSGRRARPSWYTRIMYPLLNRINRIQ